MSVSWQGFRLDIGFIDHFNTQLVITLNYSAIAHLHTLQFTFTHSKSFQTRSVFTSICLVTASNYGYSSASELKSSLNGSSLPIELFLSLESHVTTDGQSARLSWNKAPIWGLRPYFISVRQSYFATGGLPPITSPWSQGSRPEFYFQLNTCGNGPYVTSLWREDGFVSYEYAWPYNMLLKFLILRCIQLYTTCHVVWDGSLKAESHLYISLTAVYWAHRAICIKCYDFERHMNSSSHFVA
jgi:hypothetical protein